MGTNAKLGLSSILDKLGFVNVLGMTERKYGKERKVGSGLPFTWDKNNGISVVYDERGEPHIMRNRCWTKRMNEVLREFDLKRGAHVPFSNQGPDFICRLFPD